MFPIAAPPPPTGRTSPAYLATGLAAVHLLAFLATWYLARHGEAMSEFLLMVWIPIDFPVSLPVMCAHGIPPLDRIAACRYNTWPWTTTFVVHGILGTAYWFVLGQAGRKLWHWLRHRADR